MVRGAVEGRDASGPAPRPGGQPEVLLRRPSARLSHAFACFRMLVCMVSCWKKDEKAIRRGAEPLQEGRDDGRRLPPHGGRAEGAAPRLRTPRRGT